MTLLEYHPYAKTVVFSINSGVSSLRNLTTLRRGSLPQQKSKSKAEFQLTEVGITDLFLENVLCAFVPDFKNLYARVPQTVYRPDNIFIDVS